ncbi:MAG TPA: membrane dipeptidase [Sphingomicrobium sp.]|nr:membrane dipeptidase [Sphingomicrobium sp.]
MKFDRRTMMIGGAAAFAAAPLMARKAAGRGWYDRAIIIDGLGGVGDPYTPGTQTRMGERAWAETRASGVTAVNQTILPVGNVPDPWGDFLKGISDADALMDANPDHLLKVTKIDDLKVAKQSGRVGIIYGTQDTAMVGESLDRLAEMKKRGIRIVQLTYNLRNLSGDGALEPRNAGISKLGRDTIARIEQEKLLLDLSHGGARTIAEAIAAAKRPLTISHTGARALYDHPRNVADDSMKAVADKGGVVGIYFMPFLVPSSHPVTEDLLRHIDHVANLVGENHIAVGTDNGVAPQPLDEQAKKELRKWQQERIDRGIAAPGEGLDVYPLIEELNRPDRFQIVASALSKRGWRDSRLEKLFGANLVRLYGEVWS